jgi:hypothetical protein
VKKTLTLFLLGITALAAIGLAQDEKDYQTWMKTVAATNGSLRKNVEAKMGDAAAADADKLNGVFKQVAAFWEKRGGAPDAVELSNKAVAATAKISTAAKAGAWEAVAPEMSALGSTCGGCHKVHREGNPQEGFKIK